MDEPVEPPPFGPKPVMDGRLYSIGGAKHVEMWGFEPGSLNYKAEPLRARLEGSAKLD